MNDANRLPQSQNLLSLARTIRLYEEALVQANGERFNLFEILQVGHYEVRTQRLKRITDQICQDITMV